MCGLGGEIPEEVTFKSDQFEEFRCQFPEPLEELDVSRFDWAELDLPDKSRKQEVKKRSDKQDQD